MILKPCPSCKREQTIQNAEYVGEADQHLFFNCLACGSTFCIKKRIETDRATIIILVNKHSSALKKVD